MSSYKFIKNKILILDGAVPYKYKNIDLSKIYKKQNGLYRFFRKINYHTSILGRSYWYDNWKDEIEKYDIIIIFDGVMGNEIIDFIKSRNKKCRIILYYINKISINSRNNPKNFIKKDCEIWSFDKSDCELYQLRYNHYYYEYSSKKLKKTPIKNDVFFVGVDKGRLRELVNIKKILMEKGFVCDFVILKDKRKKYSLEDEKHLQEIYLDYNEVINRIAQSKTILDFVVEGQKGITLRPMEAIFHSKKLITNNKDILNYNFYDSNNIFILGYDPIDKIEKFLTENKFKDIPREIIDEYLFESWLDRFL